MYAFAQIQPMEIRNIKKGLKLQNWARRALSQPVDLTNPLIKI